MLGDCANEFSVEVEMTEAAIFAVAHQEQRLAVAHIDGESMVAIEEAFRVTLAGVTRFVLAVLVEPEKPRVAVAIGDEDGAVRGGHSGSQPPFIRSFEAGLGWSSDLLHHGSVGLHFDKEPVLFWSAFLHCCVQVLVAVLLCVYEDSGRALCTHVHVAGFVGGNSAVSATERSSSRQMSPTLNDAIGPLAISCLHSWPF